MGRKRGKLGIFLGGSLAHCATWTSSRDHVEKEGRNRVGGDKGGGAALVERGASRLLLNRTRKRGRG